MCLLKSTMYWKLFASLCFLTISTSQAKQLYFGFYDGIDLSAEGNLAYSNLNLASTPDIAIAVNAAAKANNQPPVQALLSVRDLFFGSVNGSFGLHPDYQTRWTAQIPLYNTLLHNNTIMGFNMGDELVWNCLKPADLETAIDQVRNSYPVGQAIIWYNEAAMIQDPHDSCGNKHPDYQIPKNLDWFSVDIYHMDGEVDGWVNEYVQKYYQTWIYPNLTSIQHALLVPGSFGSNVNHYPNGTYICNNSCYDIMCTHDAHDFYSWAQSDPRVAAICPWNWNGCPSCNGSRFTPPHTCCMDEIGTKDQPLLRGAWSQIGSQIIHSGSII